jgi:hypothetical protein
MPMRVDLKPEQAVPTGDDEPTRLMAVALSLSYGGRDPESSSTNDSTCCVLPSGLSTG